MSLSPQYQVAKFNNVEYRIYANNSVYTSTGTFITNKGIQGLREYLTSITYQVVKYENSEYHLYPNGSVYLDGIFVTTGGIEGL